MSPEWTDIDYDTLPCMEEYRDRETEEDGRDG